MTARVVRLPMTVNQRTGTLCRLIYLNEDNGTPFYYNLRDIYYQCDLSTVKTGFERETRAKIVAIEDYKNPFLRMRMEKLERLQQMRGYDCTGKREFMCFIYFNCAKQCLGEEKGIIATRKFNAAFSEPLPETELETTIAGVNRNIPPQRNYSGFYKLPDAWVQEALAVSTEENHTLRFGEVSAIWEGIPFTAILKRAGFRRNSSRNTAEEVTSDVNMEITESDVKSAKKVCESIGVSQPPASVDGFLPSSTVLAMYRSVTECRARRRRQVSGQLGFSFGSDGEVDYYMIS